MRSLHRLLFGPAGPHHPHRSPLRKRPAMKTLRPCFYTLALLLPTFAQADLTNGLVGWWKFDENSGVVAGDSSGLVNNGAIVNSAWVTGRINSALYFNGGSSFVQVNDSPSLRPAEFTIAGWFYLTNTPPPSEYILASKYANYQGWVFRIGSDLKPGLSVMTTNGNIGTNAYAINPIGLQTWVHVAGTYDGQVVRLYVNGALETSVSFPSGYTPYIGALMLGKASWANGGWIQGIADDVRFYSRALNSQEIQQFFGADIDGDGLPDWWEVQYGLNPQVSNRGPLPDWHWSRTVVLTNYAGVGVSNCQALIQADTSQSVALGKMRSDARDLRFLAGTNELAYWIESGAGTTNNRIWVKLPLLASTNTSLTMLYGNSNALPASDGDKTFIFFDRFTNNVLNPSKWTSAGATVNSGIVTLQNGGAFLRSVPEFDQSIGVIADYILSKNSAGNNDYYTIGFADGYDDVVGARFHWYNHAPQGANYIGFNSDKGNSGWINTGIPINNATNRYSQFYTSTKNRMEINDGLWSWSVTGLASGPENFAIGFRSDALGPIRLHGIHIRKAVDPMPASNLGLESPYFPYSDTDSDGLSDYEEFTFNTNPTVADSDSDGLPDKWELDNGTNPIVADADADTDSDGLSNALEYKLGTNANNPDSDGDGIPDGVEYFSHGTNPAVKDSDGDGMEDGWEIANSLNPMHDDAKEDRDLDGLTNFQEWTDRSEGYLANIANSKNSGKSDFESFYGYQTNRFYYDKIDRLVGGEYNHGSNGLSIAYIYDGNGNILRQKYLQRDANGNGLPDLWEFLNNLTNNTPAFVDSDGDGWTDYQEWKAGSNAGDVASVPDVLGVAGTNLVSMAWPFTPSNFVMAVGQLDGGGPEEIVIGADGDPGTTTNFFLLLSQTAAGWSTQTVNVGSIGITSLAIGQVASNLSPAVYFGSRVATDTGTVWQATVTSNVWSLTNLSLGSTGKVVHVLGLSTEPRLYFQASVISNLPGSLFKATFEESNWQTQHFSTANATRSLGKLTESVGGKLPVRLLDSGGIEISDSSAIPRDGLVGYWSFNDGDAKDFSGNNLNGQVNNGPLSVIGKVLNAMQFDGSNDHVVVPYNSMLDLPNALTISLWFKVDAWGATRRIVGRTYTNNNALLYSILADGGNIWFYLQDGISGGAKSVSMPLPTPGQWHHLVTTWDGGTMRMFFHGTNVGSTTATGSIPARANPLFIGTKENASEFFQGALDEVLLYSRAITTQEVSQLYQFQGGRFLAEPATTDSLNWRGHAFASGDLRGINSNSLFYAAIDDRNTNNAVDESDALVLAEYRLVATNDTPFQVQTSIVTTGSQSSYGMAALPFTGGTNDILFTAEPDGSIYSWFATNATNPLQRQLFSAHRAGKAWHQLEGHKGFGVGEALTGLWVDPTNPAVCNLACFAPATELYAPLAFPQNAPVATILPAPDSGQGIAPVSIRLWDAEGNLSLPQLQVSTNSGSWWSNATIASLNGGALGYVAAAPTGTTHSVLWNAAADLGAAYTNTVQLRLRARDNSLVGSWSPVVSYSLAISAGNPIAYNDTVVTLEDAPLNIAVLANDHVEGGQSLSVSDLVQPSFGFAVVTASNTVYYTPSTNYSGVDSFSYTARDTFGGTSVASVSVTVIPVNDPPVAGPYTFNTTEDFPLSLRWNPARDGEGDIVTLQSTGPASANGGSVGVVDGVLTYQPPLNFNGQDTFTYTLVDNGKTDGTNDFKTAIGTVAVSVNAVNDAPVVSVPGPQTTGEDTPLVFGSTNLVTVVDPDAGTGLMEFTLSATQGRLTLSTTNGLTFSTGTNGGKSFVFTSALTAAKTALTNLVYLPDTNYHGADLLNISANDLGNTGAGGPLADAKAISIGIASVNDLPAIFLTSPTSNQEFIAPAVVTLQASASDVDGAVVKVEFFAGTSKLGERTNLPYVYVWSNVNVGSYALTAVATDNLGDTNTSPTVMISSLTPGFVQLAAPQMAAGGSFSLIVVGTPGEVYNIEASTNMMTWQVVGTITNQTGTVPFQETVPAGSGKRYYRAVIVP